MTTDQITTDCPARHINVERVNESTVVVWEDGRKPKQYERLASEDNPQFVRRAIDDYRRWSRSMDDLSEAISAALTIENGAET
jgi:hypothetical protein